jgi:Glycoside hydrolase family 44
MCTGRACLFLLIAIPLACDSGSSHSPVDGAAGIGGIAGGDGGTGGLGGIGGTPITPGNPGNPDVTFTIDSAKSHAISPYIYGTNSGDFTKEAKGLTLSRMGGNRLTAYNWETNASNAGSDWQYSNDNYMSSSTTPGLAMKQATQAALDNGASMIMTVPIAGWVSADENGSCEKAPTAAQIAQRFFPILPKKGSAYAYPPDLSDGKVYADEFVAYLESQFPTAQTDPARRIFYMLDNEPDLWSSTHSEIHPTAVTYAELVQRSTDFATGIKTAAPKALVFGPVNYGWQGMVDLQGASDANKRDFIEFYLDAMKAAEQTAGKRLLDVLDVHWYPEAQGDNARIVDEGVTTGEVEARLQAPRSLWDTSYTETSWITQWSTQGPIYLIPRLQAKIDQHYPGTKLSISEYNYGAGGDISGGIAQADVLGVYGREGVFAASMWPPGSKLQFIFAGFAMYRNYDGKGATFGDTSISATTSAVDATSVYASVSAANPANVIVVAINKTTTPKVAGITLSHPTQLSAADVYTLTSASAAPTPGTALAAVATNAFSYTMPARSVSTIVFHP